MVEGRRLCKHMAVGHLHYTTLQWMHVDQIVPRGTTWTLTVIDCMTVGDDKAIWCGCMGPMHVIDRQPTGATDVAAESQQRPQHSAPPMHCQIISTPQ